jgi:hypothetical protein
MLPVYTTVNHITGSKKSVDTSTWTTTIAKKALVGIV